MTQVRSTKNTFTGKDAKAVAGALARSRKDGTAHSRMVAASRKSFPVRSKKSR